MHWSIVDHAYGRRIWTGGYSAALAPTGDAQESSERSSTAISHVLREGVIEVAEVLRPPPPLRPSPPSTDQIMSQSPKPIDDAKPSDGPEYGEEAFAGISTEHLYQKLQPITVPPHSPRARFNNWGQTWYCTPLAVFEPETVEQCGTILELARREGKVVRAVGVGHSPSDLACTTGFMIRMTRMNKIIEISSEKRCFEAEAGITLNELHQELGGHGLAFSSLGSISEQTLAGVISTSTHGTGLAFHLIGKTVTELTLLLADGSVAVCSPTRDSDLFNATLCGIGATGVILRVKMTVEPAFRLKEIGETLPFDEFIGKMGELAKRAEHPRFWWFPAAGTVRCGYANRTTEPIRTNGSWFWDRLLAYHAVQAILFAGRYITSLNTYAGRFAAWLASGDSVVVNDSYKVFNVDCRYPQNTTEWALPLRNAEACIREFREWIEKEIRDPNGIRPHFPIEMRVTAADDLWLSPSRAETTCWIGIVQFKPYGFDTPYHKYFDHFERVVFKHGGRPHWAKAHKLKPDDLRKLYPKFDDFRSVLDRVDVEGIFRSEYVQRHVFGVDVDPRVFKKRVLPGATR